MKPASLNERGSIRGWLEPDENRVHLETILRKAPSAVLEGELTLKVHEDLAETTDTAKREQRVTELVQALYRGTIKRYVVQSDTSVGPRIIKLTESQSLSHRLGGLIGFSTGRLEHQNQIRAESLGIAAAHSHGYLELCRSPWLIRSAQVQSLISPELPMLDDFVRREYERFGPAAMLPLGEALAHTHALGFFHADLKGFHAQIAHQRLVPHEPTRYTLLWLDLGRVKFTVTERRRIINLYQMLRFVVPNHGRARDAFMRSYSKESGWYRDSPNRAMEIVGRFLDKKLRAHQREPV